ncbi:hypothetical protein LCGC14_0474690 [marine sediment metagenome]|uniref:Uncharacterized protein n=1 Tax=marine sediment metagenome TaxID=412755 RepID=A0A0F9SGJ0_9ZZZZ
MKFLNTLALSLCLLLGASWLFATDWPQGGAGGGTHPVNLASDVTGELPHASTSDDVANVHGLGASVNVLGNRDGSGKFTESGTNNPSAVGAGNNVVYQSAFGDSITYGTAFSSTPVVVYGGTQDDTGAAYVNGAFDKVSTTGFDAAYLSTTGSHDLANGGWIALGS